MSLYIYLCMLFNFVQIAIFSSHEFSTIFVFSTSLDLAITILSLTLDVQGQFTTGGLHDHHRI